MKTKLTIRKRCVFSDVYSDATIESDAKLVAKCLNRDYDVKWFRKRIEDGKPIYVGETNYDDTRTYYPHAKGIIARRQWNKFFTILKSCSKDFRD